MQAPQPAPSHVLPAPGTLAADVLSGLSATPKHLSSKWFYDDAGSRLFQQIMALPEYYLTDCEAEILREQASDMAFLLGSAPVNVVELGAGDGSKTVLLLQALQSAGLLAEYLPIDISGEAIRSLRRAMRQALPQLQVNGIVADYATGLKQVQQTGQRNLVLFLGSTVGNFAPDEAVRFLRMLRGRMRSGDFFLIGADLKKDPAILLPAYNDPQGVTREFNRNLLRRINRELDADFNPEAFLHHALYDPVRGTMESFLLSQRRQTVQVGVLGRQFSFDAWEAIHTEVSYKYSPAQLEQLAADTGFRPLQQFSDARGWFVDAVWRAD